MLSHFGQTEEVYPLLLLLSRPFSCVRSLSYYSTGSSLWSTMLQLFWNSRFKGRLCAFALNWLSPSDLYFFINSRSLSLSDDIDRTVSEFHTWSSLFAIIWSAPLWGYSAFDTSYGKILWGKFWARFLISVLVWAHCGFSESVLEFQNIILSLAVEHWCMPRGFRTLEMLKLKVEPEEDFDQSLFWVHLAWSFNVLLLWIASCPETFFSIPWSFVLGKYPCLAATILKRLRLCVLD